VGHKQQLIRQSVPEPSNPSRLRRSFRSNINGASMLAYMGVPNSAVYAATKAYELVKSEGLWQLIYCIADKTTYIVSYKAVRVLLLKHTE